jgi:predicted dehydrogenase
MKTVNIGLVGSGFIAGAHASCYANDLRARVKKVADSDAQKRAEFQARFGVPEATGDWRDLVEDADIDVIDIAAPNFMHAEIAIAAIRAGKALVVEKPLALNLDDGRRILAALRERPVVSLYAENRLFAPVYRKAREYIASGALGDLRILRVNEMGSGPGHGKWFWDKSKTGGGALIDMGIHGLCMAEWLFGEPIVSLQALTASTRAKGAGEEEVEDTAVTIARFRSGAVAQFVCSWAIQGGLDIRTEIFGSGGSVYLDQSTTINGLRVYQSEAPVAQENRPHTASQVGWSYPAVDEWNVKGHSFELRHFVDCFLEGRPTESPLARGFRALQLVSLVYKAAASRREVAVPEPEDE